MQRLSRYLMAGALLGFALGARGDDVTTQLAAKLKVRPDAISPGPLPGIYRVTVGPQVAYVSADGRYLIRGEIIDLKDGSNLTATQRDAARLATLESIGEKNMIVFAPAHPNPKHTLTVLTDIDCGYCRQLAQDMTELTADGVEIRYIAYPRTGVNTPSWDKAVSVWCAKDREAAYQEAMRDGVVKPLKCDPAPVLAGYEFARQLGFTGTPIMITERGRLIAGYIPAAALEQALDQPGDDDLE